MPNFVKVTLGDLPLRGKFTPKLPILFILGSKMTFLKPQ